MQPGIGGGRRGHLPAECSATFRRSQRGPFALAIVTGEYSSSLAAKTTITTTANEPSDQLFLLVVGDGIPVTEALPRVGAVVLGRAADCDIRIDDGSISRNHAVLQLAPTLRIADSNSANGTWVRDLRLAPNQPVEVRVDEVIRLGSVTIIVQRRSRRALPPRRIRSSMSRVW